MSIILSSNDVIVTKASLNDLDQQSAVVRLINDYRTDPMGGRLPAMSGDEEVKLISLLRCHPFCHLFLAAIDRRFVGLIVSFVTISTFQAKPLLNVHDLIVTEKFRRQGVGKQLLAEAKEFARSRGCCRMTLEVRTDNPGARSLYRSIGFMPCDPSMDFWRLEL